MVEGTEHYRNLEARGVEPIAAMEQAAVAGIPVEMHDAVLRNLNIAMALKYLLRCGSKDAPDSELQKAQNYVHRARYGIWPWEVGTGA